ncbi:hypothetical protein [Rhodanobacter sp. IGA1.0]
MGFFLRAARRRRVGAGAAWIMDHSRLPLGS